MAVAFDTATTQDLTVATTWSHTCTGANGLLVVDILDEGTVPTGLAYNGVAMTLHQTNTGSNTGLRGTRWKLAGPATGSHSIVVTGGSGLRLAAATSFTGADQTTPLIGGGNGAGTNVGTGITMNVASTAATDLVLDCVWSTATATSSTPGAGQTERVDFTAFLFGSSRLITCTTEPGNGGTVTMSETLSGGFGSDQMAHRIQAAAPPPKSPPFSSRTARNTLLRR